MLNYQISTDTGVEEDVKGIWAIDSTMNSAIGVSDTIDIPSSQDNFFVCSVVVFGYHVSNI